MAFVARAERKLVLYTSTPSQGPGSYISHSSYKPSTSYVPFSSSTERSWDRSNSNYTPGPGSYIDPTAKPKAQTNSSSSFASNKPRFDSKHDTALGPGSYNIKPTWSEKKLQSKSSTPVNWVRLPSAPSIPGQNQGYGYDETSNGELILHKGRDYISGTAKDSVGPGHYDPKPIIPKAKASLWHKSAVKRETLPISKSAASVPGPGSYTTSKTTPKYQQKPNAVFISSCKRGTDLDPEESSEEGVPGPGQYAVKSSFTPSPPRAVPHNFGSCCARFKSATPETELLGLGPGQYNLPPSFEIKKGRNKAPFCSSNMRFHSNFEITPGPGSYKQAEVQRKVWGKQGAFGCTEKRFYSRSNSNIHGKSMNGAEEPGPGTYATEARVGMHNSAKNRGLSVFLSKAKRMAGTGLSETPPPGSYEIVSPIGYVRPPPVPIHPVLVRENQSPKNVGFCAQAERFFQPNTNVPGPGAYKVEGGRKFKAVVVSKDKRFKDIRANAPGPGHYDETQNWNKKTYNVLFE